MIRTLNFVRCDVCKDAEIDMGSPALREWWIVRERSENIDANRDVCPKCIGRLFPVEPSIKAPPVEWISTCGNCRERVMFEDVHFDDETSRWTCMPWQAPCSGDAY